MSTTTPQTTDGHVSPQQAFDRFVWRNSRCCNGCFEHIRDVDKFEVRRSLDVEERTRTPQATLEQGSVIQDDYGELEVGQPMTTCRSCARVGCWAESETLSRIQALRLVAPLAERLREQGAAFDEDVLRKFVDVGKRMEDAQGKDTEIFRIAVKYAMKWG